MIRTTYLLFAAVKVRDDPVPADELQGLITGLVPQLHLNTNGEEACHVDACHVLQLTCCMSLDSLVLTAQLHIPLTNATGIWPRRHMSVMTQTTQEDTYLVVIK